MKQILLITCIASFFQSVAQKQDGILLINERYKSFNNFNFVSKEDTTIIDGLTKGNNFSNAPFRRIQYSDSNVILIHGTMYAKNDTMFIPTNGKYKFVKIGDNVYKIASPSLQLAPNEPPFTESKNATIGRWENLPIYPKSKLLDIAPTDTLVYRRPYGRVNFKPNKEQIK